MSSKALHFFLLLFIFTLSFSAINAQQTPAQPAGGFKLFFEKVYLHVDRTYYASGDDIWFKAYLVNGQTNVPINTSNNLYVELIDPTATIISRKVIRLDSAMGIGDFQLGDSASGGTYRIRAYTNWMRNFGSRFIFEKEIQVTNIQGLPTVNAAVNSKIKPAKVASTEGYKIQFLPESGSMVEDVATVVAFKAEDVNGKGVDAKGAIVSEKGDTVARFNTTQLGMGSFAFTPKAHTQYKAFIKYRNNPPISAPFPAASPTGFVMNITSPDTSVFVATINTNGATSQLHPTGVINIAARHAGKSYFKQELNLKNNQAVVNIPAKDFPAGIAYITLYDENMKPNCERLVYVDKSDPLNVLVSSDKNTYASKEKSTVEISVTDAQHQPVKTALSMAVVEEALDAPAKSNILSDLMLESDLQGKIENPTAYFDKSNANRLQQLDLLLRTQGWRSFLWRQIADTTIRISYLPEPGITISGNVTKPLSNRPLDNMNITLFAPGAKGDKIYMTKTNAQGKYYLDGLPLYGIQTVKLNVGDGIGKRIGEIKTDTMYNNPLPVFRSPYYNIDTSIALNNFKTEAARRSSKFKNSQWFNILPQVTVTNKRNTAILRDGSVVRTFGYPEYDFNITAKDYEYQRLRDFIVQKVPGASYDEEMEGVTFLHDGKPVRPVLIVNKKEDGFNRLDYYSLSMQQVESVSVRHMVGSPTYATTGVENTDDNTETDNQSRRAGRSFRDYYLINLVVKPGNYDQQVSKINTEVTGYYEARVFYSPNYSKDDTSKEDKRITIHWEPLVKTDANGKATISFYNADPKGRVKVHVQGLTANGIPVVAETKYDVK